MRYGSPDAVAACVGHLYVAGICIHCGDFEKVTLGGFEFEELKDCAVGAMFSVDPDGDPGVGQ